MKFKSFILATIMILSLLLSIGAPVYAADAYLTPIDAANPFFETTFKEIEANIAEGNKNSINPSYDLFPVLEQKNNFMSLGTSTYENINGKTVTADSFYRVKDQASNDPNFGAGLMIYQAIQYKIAHPDEAVSIDFSSYRLSPTAAVCVIPQSKYYGYMRSLYDRDYDEHGFVRFSYMLTEAARMGIDVDVLWQLNSYSVKQYNASGALVSKSELKSSTYYAQAVKSACYDKYASGKKVSDFMTYKQVDWAISDKGSIDMMHLKACTVSNYRDSNGVDHGPAVWFSSANLDAIDYKGCNGNNGSQSGVLIANHDELYNITCNYINLIMSNSGQEKVYELRDLVNRRNTEQAELIRAGRGNEIPKNERIIYLGSDTDSIFKLYFTGLGGYNNAWDTENNPFCEYTEKLAKSDDYIEFVWNNSTFTNFYISDIMMKMVENAFHNNRNIENKVEIQLDSYDLTAWDDLTVGKDIGFKSVDISTGIHAKDILMSYTTADDIRHNVSLMTSCTFHGGALYYQTNSILVIDETEETGDNFYENFAETYSYGAITKDYGGMKFEQNTRHIVETKPEAMPVTFEAVIKPVANSTGGVILGSNDKYSPCIDYAINENGAPKVFFRDAGKTEYECVFSNVNTISTEPIHMAIVLDMANNSVHCYINGTLRQTVSGVPSSAFLPAQKYVVGGNMRRANFEYFTGDILNVAVWSDIRTSDEILADYQNGLNANDVNLLFAYDLTAEENNLLDLSANSNDLYIDNLWNDEVEPVSDYAYSFAVVGDTQELTEDLPDATKAVYDWILENKDSQNIRLVMGLGDITQKNLANEWSVAKENISRLDGQIPYTLVRGNHDGNVGFNTTFGDSAYTKQVTGCMVEGDYTNTYKLLTVGETDYLILCLDFGPSDEMLEWASDVVEQYPNHRVIVTTHQYMYRDGTTLDANDAYPASKAPGRNDTGSAFTRDFNDGDDMWEEFVSKHSNIVMVLSGHDAFDSIVYRQDIGENGNQVTQMLINPQDLDHNYQPEGGTGMVAMLYFSEDGNKVDVRYYSTVRKQYGTESSQFALDLSPILDGYKVKNAKIENKVFSADVKFDGSFKAQTATAIIALYDADGRFIETKTTSINVAEGTVPVSISVDSSTYGAYKFMIWESIGTNVPVTVEINDSLSE